MGHHPCGLATVRGAAFPPVGRAALSGQSTTVLGGTVGGISAMIRQRLRSLSRQIGLGTAGLGAIVLLGWIFQPEWLVSGVPGSLAMRMNTAVGLVLAGSALWSYHQSATATQARAWRSLAIGCACLMIGMGALTLYEVAFDQALGLDPSLRSPASQPPDTMTAGRMPIIVAVNCILLGVAILGLYGHAISLAQGVALFVFLLSLLGLVGYLYQTPDYDSLLGGIRVTFPAIAAFWLLSLGMLWACPDRGWCSVITSPYAGGIAARRLLPVIIGMPLLIGSFKLTHHPSELSDDVIQISRLLLNILVLGSVTWWIARFLNTLDARQQQTEATLRTATDQLEQQIAARTAELVATNQQLQANYQLIISIINGISDPIFVKDRQGRFVVVNTATATKFGRSIEDILGRTDLDLHPPDIGQALMEQDFALMEQDTTQILEEEVRHQGGLKTFLSTKSPWRDPTGSIIGLIAFSKDITDRKQAEDRLRYQEWLTRFFLENIPMPAAVFDREMRYLMVSHQWRTDYHLEDQPLVGRSHYDLFPDIPQTWKDIHQRCLAGAIEVGEDEPFLRADGTLEWLCWVVRPWYEETGAIGGIILFTEVVTQRKEAEIALRLSQQQYKSLAIAAPVGIFRTTPDGHCVYANQHWCELTGLSLKQGMGFGWATALHPDDRDRVVQAWKVTTQNGQIYRDEFRLRRPDQSISWVFVQAVAERNSQGTVLGYVGTVTDITDRKQAETALAVSEERLRLALIASNQGLYDLNVQTGVAIVSPEYAQMLGYPAETFQETNASWRDRLHPDEHDQVVQIYQDYLAGKRDDYRLEFRQRTRTGDWKWVLSVGKIVGWDDQGRPLRIIGTHTDISDRKHAEATLNQQQEILQTIVDNIPVMLAYFDPNNQFRWVNRQWEQVLGWTFEEAKQRDVLADCYPDPRYRQSVIAYIQAATETWQDFKTRVRDGTILDTAWANVRLSDGSSIGIGQDITERKRAEHQLRTVSDRLSLAVQSAKLGIWDWDILNDQQTWNDYLYELYGLPAADQIETYARWASVVHPEDWPTCHVVIQQVLLNQVNCQLEFRVVWPDHTIRHIESHMLVQRDATGQPLRMIGVNLDITHRKQAETQLRDLSDRLTLAIQSVQMGIWDWEIGPNRLTWDDRMYALYGLHPDNFQGGYEAWQERVHPDDFPHAAAIVQQALAGGPNKPLEFRVLWPDGTLRYLEAHFLVQNDAQGLPQRVTGVNVDITDRKQAELALQELNETLEQRVKDRTTELTAANQELEAFSYSVSHDLRAPLRGIDGFSKALAERYADQFDDKGRHYLNRIRAGTQRMGELIDDLLTLSRVTRADMRRIPVDLSAIAHTITSELMASQPDRPVEWHIAPDILATGDPRLLKVVLENLLNNAWKFTFTKAQAQIEFGCMIKNGQNPCIYFVKDNGAGFDMGYRDRLFQPFQRLHAAQEFPGNGIGLATVHRIIQRHGGSVWAEGNLGQGATFYFTLSQ